MKQEKKELILFETQNGTIKLHSNFTDEQNYIWASLDQMAMLFGRDKSVVSRHIKNIFKEEELERKSVVAFFATTANDGKTYQVEHFNIDIIISVGYRINGKIATEFRKWATKHLKQHITKGYTLNKKVLQKNHQEFLKTINDFQKTLTDQKLLKSENILELVKSFSHTWFSLDAFDKENFHKKTFSQKNIKIEARNLYKDVEKFKNELIHKKEATDLFAKEKNLKSLEGILGNVFQSAFGNDIYPSIEQKAAHILYFIIKNHPFIDGNKRTGAFAFIWFLKKAQYNFSHITPETLTALALFVAQSNPKEKEKIIGLILLLLKK